jgi:hypothetical protein
MNNFVEKINNRLRRKEKHDENMNIFFIGNKKNP